VAFSCPKLWVNLTVVIVVLVVHLIPAWEKAYAQYAICQKNDKIMSPLVSQTCPIRVYWDNSFRNRMNVKSNIRETKDSPLGITIGNAVEVAGSRSHDVDITSFVVVVRVT
jgi:hypothetical protein